MRVDRVSASLNDDGEQQIIMVVLAFPPVLNNNRIQPKSSNTGMHIFQNVGHKLLVVLIRRNCFKTVIYFFFFGGGGGEGATGLGSVPPKNEVSFPLTVKIWLFSVKRSKPGGVGGSQLLTIKILLSWSFFLLLLTCVTQRGIDHKEELKVKFHDYHIFILTLIIAQIVE